MTAAEAQAPKWDSSKWVMGGFLAYTCAFNWWVCAPLRPLEEMPLSGEQYANVMFWGADMPSITALMIAVLVSNLRKRLRPPKRFPFAAVHGHSAWSLN